MNCKNDRLFGLERDKCLATVKKTLAFEVQGFEASINTCVCESRSKCGILIGITSTGKGKFWRTKEPEREQRCASAVGDSAKDFCLWDVTMCKYLLFHWLTAHKICYANNAGRVQPLITNVVYVLGACIPENRTAYAAFCTTMRLRGTLYNARHVPE